jgi:hypothetical protein
MPLAPAYLALLERSGGAAIFRVFLPSIRPAFAPVRETRSFACPSARQLHAVSNESHAFRFQSDSLFEPGLSW